MDHKPAIEVLGSDVIVGCPAQSVGLMRRNAGAAAIGGLAGVLAMKMLRKDMIENNSPGGHSGQVYICLGQTRIAVFEQKNGLSGSSLGRLLATHDLTAITTCDWCPSKFSLSHLTIAATGAGPYELEVALIHKGKASQIADVVRAQRANAA